MAARTRNAGKWTEAQYWGRVRSALRKAFAAWEPAKLSEHAARRPVEKGRQKWEYQCAACGEWFARKEVYRDHILPVGTLRCAEDLVGFLERLTPEDPDAYQILCGDCHRDKTEKEKSNGTATTKHEMIDVMAPLEQCAKTNDA